ncbi:hypothetical protein T05_3074 [Trichinella murrelli]|uniref:Uncharacterized protein n=1 Tax=Trichinella murrelli TaxID=144512 RepID=A0A0V0STI9_9BILA|nr:hypothetical protein T05_3074 [Trichinella murrelli]
MFYLERFKRRWYSQKKLGYEKSSTCIYKERVVAPRTPVTDVLQTSNSQYIRTLCDYYASVVYWNTVCGHTPKVSNKSCST